MESKAMLETFLSNRKQCVENGAIYSNWEIGWQLTMESLKEQFMEKIRITLSIFYNNGNFLKPKVSFRYLCLMIENILNFDAELDKMLTKVASAIRSMYLVRHLLPLKAIIVLFKSLVVSYFNFSALFFQSLPASSLHKIGGGELGYSGLPYF